MKIQQITERPNLGAELQEAWERLLEVPGTGHSLSVHLLKGENSFVMANVDGFHGVAEITGDPRTAVSILASRVLDPNLVAARRDALKKQLAEAQIALESLEWRTAQKQEVA